jgi:hypothetical protein
MDGYLKVLSCQHLERPTFSSEEWNFIERQQVEVSLSAVDAEPC